MNRLLVLSSPLTRSIFFTEIGMFFSELDVCTCAACYWKYFSFFHTDTYNKMNPILIMSESYSTDPDIAQ
jgi:hypothetical protein